MSENDPSNHSEHALPDSLRKQLKQFRSHVWRIKVLEAILAGFFGLLLSYILVFTLDRFVPTHAVVRLLILVAGVSLFAIFAPLWINRWVFKHRKENQLAHLIAKQYPRLGDRLLGVVELQNQDETSTSLSPRLREAAMHEVAHEVKDRNLQSALPKSWHKKWSLAVVGLAALTTTAWVLSPKASVNALQRWLMPLADIERYTKTKIDLSALPQPLYVAHGEEFSVNIPLTDDSNQPKSAKARQGIQAWMSSPAKNRSYQFSFPKIYKPQELEFRVGDAFVTLDVTPVMRPNIQEISARVSFPEYLEKEDEIIDLTNGQATIVEGSYVELTAQVNRKLRSATARLTSPSESQQSHKLQTAIRADQFTLSPILIEKDRIDLTLNWVDIHQLNNLTPTKLGIDKQVDTPPSVYLQNIATEIYVLADEAIEFEVLAEDDFGIKQAGIEWQGSFSKPSPHTPAKGSLTLIEGSPSLRNASEPMIYSFRAYDIRPQKLVMRSWADDYNPAHKRSYSAPITVFVLTKDEHRELIEERAQSAINKLEDLMRAELDALDENTRLERKSGKELQQDENLEKLADQAEREKQNAEAMKELSEKMQEIFKEATKNGEIDTNTMKKLAESALDMKQMAEQSMPEIAKKLSDAQSPENTEERSKEDVQEAVKKQNDLLKKMEETIAKANEASKQLEAGTFVNRLRKAAADEEQIANTVIEAIREPRNDTVHVASRTFDELDPADQRTMVDAFALQNQATSDVRWIQEDLSHFFLRTQQAEHKELMDKMQAAKIDTQMNTILRFIEKNHNGYTVRHTKKTAELFRKWASELEGAANDPSGGGGGGGGGGGNSEDEDFEFMLKVFELMQKEMNIRDTNRSLEQKRRLLEKSPSRSDKAPAPRTPKLQPIQ